MLNALSITPTNTELGTVYYMKGVLDERSDFSIIQQTNNTPVHLNISGVMRISSLGIKKWIKFITDLQANHTVYIHECSTCFVSQINLVPGILQNCKIQSFTLPFYCYTCQKDTSIQISNTELSSEKIEKIDSSYKCDGCTEFLQLDASIEDYEEIIKRDPNQD